MPYLTERNSTTIIRSRLSNVGLEAVIRFERNWTLTEVDSILFSVIAPTAPILAGRLYDVWADQNLTLKLATCYVANPGRKTIRNHPLASDQSEILVYEALAVGPTAFLKRKKLNIQVSNKRISDIAKEIIQKVALDYPISSDYSFIQQIDFTINADHVGRTAFEILESYRDLGTAYYIDDDLKFHFFEDEGEILGYSWDDNTAYLQELPLNVDVSDLKNAVIITGADKAKQAPDLTITGTGDLTTGLDYNLPHNVKFNDDFLLEDWTGIDEAIWEIGDSKDSVSPLSPDGSRIFLGNSSIYVDGGNTFQGPNIVRRRIASERIEGNALIQTVTFGNFGNGYITAYSDGNGGDDINLMGFYLTSSGQLQGKEKGNSYIPSTPVTVKRSFGEDDNITISGLSLDRKTFTVPTGIGAYLQTGDSVQILGNSIGFVDTSIASISGDSVTIATPLPDGSITGAKLIRIAIYRLILQVKESGFIYRIQGEQYGQLNSGIYTDILETSLDVTQFLYAVPFAPKDATCILNVEDTFVNPSAGATFVRDGKVMLVAPESEGSSFDFPVLIRPADPRRNPPLFRYRAQRFIASAFGTANTTSSIRLSENDYNNCLKGDRLIINKQETFITDKLEAPYRIIVSPALSAAPADGTQIFVGTTAAALGQDGVFKFSYPVPNRRYQKDTASIALYGIAEDEQIIDASLRTSEDITARWEAFRQAKAQPKIVGSTVFQFSPILEL